MTSLRFAVFMLLLRSLCLANDVHFLPPDSTDLLWTRSDLWTPSPPTETSNVYIDGSQLESSIFVNNDDVIINSLHLTNVVISIDCSSITVNSFTSFIDSSIESTCDILSKFTSLTYEFIGVTKLSGINLIVFDFGKLIEPQLTLVNSKVIVKENATLIVDQSDTSSLLIAWGRGADGRTGTGNQGNHGLMPVHTDQKFISIAAGEGHSLGLTRDGFLYSWGANSRGQLGLGDTTNRLVPTKLNLINVVQVSTGSDHSLVRLDNGDVYSFGSSDLGVLGHGTSGTDELLPRKINNLSNVVDISTGAQNSFAVSSNGEVKAWGCCPGSLGTDTPLFILLPIPLSLVKNTKGQLCVGDTTDRDVPTAIVNSRDFHVIQARPCKLSSYQHHETTIFLTAQGEVFSCGRAIGRSTDTVPSHTPGKVEGMGVVSSIYKGLYGVNIALSTDGTLYSWRYSDWELLVPSPVTETSELKVGKYFPGTFHRFAQETVHTDITGDEDSSIEIAGKLENRLEFPLLLNISVIIHSSGFLSSFLPVKFLTKLETFGTVKCDQFLEFNSFSLIALFGGNIEASHIAVQQYASITGFGSINSTVVNYGKIKPSGVLQIYKHLTIAEKSNFLLNYNNNETQLIVNGILSVNGLFSFTFPNSIPPNYTISLVLFGSLLSEHDSFRVQCDQYFDLFLMILLSAW
ncbi:hypothetical protein GEMRC1_007335 [Eukaryota sp. GEM-RC1]